MANEEPPRYAPSQAQHWSTPQRSHRAECEVCKEMWTDTVGNEHLIFSIAREHCADNRHAVTITSVTRITVSPPKKETA